MLPKVGNTQFIGLFIPTSNIQNKTTMRNFCGSHLFVNQPDTIGKLKNLIVGKYLVFIQTLIEKAAKI
jgi:hypothetical protein